MLKNVTLKAKTAQQDDFKSSVAMLPNRKWSAFFKNIKDALSADRIQCVLCATSDTLHNVHTPTVLIASKAGVLLKVTNAGSNDRGRENCHTTDCSMKLQKKCIQISLEESFTVEE